MGLFSYLEVWHVLERFPITTPRDIVKLLLDNSCKALKIHGIPLGNTFGIFKGNVEGMRWK